ncbi:hypothetical protein B0A50_06397 [Salinomyces thailandicus]|uniref:Uncharacterized protein n=1 Tax=Salinomyces thailandicus TaxID=706561 RepID=A0A4U0TRF2_9PEZI|nr:hypothetical protein B0A50_06397 [Salinomyces thailandica]
MSNDNPPTTQRKDQDSTLLTAAPELRNNIYVLALTQSADIRVPSTAQVTVPPLLQVCSQIRQEATQLYYAVNTFKAEIRDGNLHSALPWLGAIGHVPCKSLRKLVFEYHPAAEKDNFAEGSFRADIEEYLEKTTDLMIRGVGGEEVKEVSAKWQEKLMLRLVDVAEIFFRVKQKGVLVEPEFVAAAGEYEDVPRYELKEVLDNAKVATMYLELGRFDAVMLDRVLEEYARRRADGTLLDIFGGAIRRGLAALKH